MRFSRFSLLTSVACFMVVLVSVPPQASAQTAAEPALATAAPHPATLAAASSFIQALGDRAITILADTTLSAAARDQQFRQMLRQSFDLATIGRFVIGRAWRTATPEQQREYLDLFEKLVVQIYSDRFAAYSGETIRVVGARPEGERDIMVTSQIVHPNNTAPNTVDWRVRNYGDHMAVIDVIVEGISMSVTQRQEYASVLQRSGGSVEALLDLMRQNVTHNTANAAH